MTTARLDWVARSSLGTDYDCWELVLTTGKTLTVFGWLYRDTHERADEYKVRSNNGAVIKLPADLTLDDAKSAAKLLLMTGGRE